jgi:hypothetical protein
LRERTQSRYIRILVRIARLEVSFPSISRKICAMPANTISTILQGFPRLISWLKSENFFSSLIIVKIILTQEFGFCTIIPENNNWEAFNTLAHF